MRPRRLFRTRADRGCCRICHLALLCAIWIGTLVPHAVFAQSDPASPLPTLEVFQRLAEEIGDKVADSMLVDDSSRVSLTVQPRMDTWYLNKGIARAFARKGHSVTDASSSSVDVEFGAERIGVRYEDLRRSWFLGARVATRKAFLTMTVKLTRRSGAGEIVQRDYSVESNDSVYVRDLPDLESPLIPATRGVIPEEGFLSNPVEAVIMTGAVGIAVYLLFTVRS